MMWWSKLVCTSAQRRRDNNSTSQGTRHGTSESSHDHDKVPISFLYCVALEDSNSPASEPEWNDGSLGFASMPVGRSLALQESWGPP